MRRAIFTKLTGVNFNVDMGGKGIVRGEIVVGLSVGCELPNSNTLSGCIEKNIPILMLPDDVKEDLRKVYNKIQKLVEDGQDWEG